MTSKYIKLRNIGAIITGNTPQTSNILNYNSNDICFVKPGDLMENDITDIDETEFYISEYAREKARTLPPDSVLVTCIGIIGKVGINKCECAFNQQINAIIPNRDRFLSKYVAYSILSKQKQIQDVANAPVVPIINKTQFSDIEIKFMSIDEQQIIVSTLDKVTDLIEKKKQQLSKLDELIKARFVEMFGDPATNPMGWTEVGISKVAGGKVSNGFFAKRDDYHEDGNVSVMGVAYIVNRMYSQWNNLPRTNGTEKDIEKYEVNYGDMLFCRSSLVAEGIGKASIVPKDVPRKTLFECHVIRLPLDLDKCVPEFMQILSTTDYFRKQIIAQSKTATMTTIGQDGILKANIILPPIEIQNEFAAFVARVNKSKGEIQKSLEKLETLKKSLMQKYFG